jgi:predicted transcriptional regulator
MKTFHVKYDPKSSTNVLNRLRAAVKTRTPQGDAGVLWCDSYESMFRVISPARMDIIDAIREHKPDSIYELAKLLERDVGNVHRDVKSLAEIGILRLDEADSGDRERMRPVVLFDKIVWEMELPKKRAV